MTGEFPRRRELAEAVADHVLGYKYWNKELSVVNVERHTHEFGRNHRSARPGSYHLLRTRLCRLLYLALQARIDEGALLERSRHLLLPPPLDDVLLRTRLLARLVTLGRDAPRRTRVTTAR